MISSSFVGGALGARSACLENNVTRSAVLPFSGCLLFTGGRALGLTGLALALLEPSLVLPGPLAFPAGRGLIAGFEACLEDFRNGGVGDGVVCRVAFIFDELGRGRSGEEKRYLLRVFT